MSAKRGPPVSMDNALIDGLVLSVGVMMAGEADAVTNQDEEDGKIRDAIERVSVGQTNEGNKVS